jgi:solute carrier family 45 protein 1/2/4
MRSGIKCKLFNACMQIAQMVVALGAGPWDALFGGGNEPAFSFAALFALAAGVVALIKLPRLSRGVHPTTISGHGFG